VFGNSRHYFEQQRSEVITEPAGVGAALSMDAPFLSGAESSAADFDALVEANRALVNQLHRDERMPSLMEQLADSSGAPNHSYFAEPHTPDQWGAQVGAQRSFVLLLYAALLASALLRSANRQQDCNEQ
jgi:hypothetical protein